MADRRLYYDDPAQERVLTRVVESGMLEGRPFVRLEETIFYPEGGGQPADRGTIAGISVLDVKARGSDVLHFLERALPVSDASVSALLDGARRFDFRQQHSAQHLLSALLEDRHAQPTTSFHLGDAYTAIEVRGGVPAQAKLRALEEEMQQAIRDDLEVRTFWVEPQELPALEVRSRGLPEGHVGPVRLVEIEGLDLNTCGGTHVRHLSEIQVVRLLGAEPARGGARIRFLAGGRVLRELGRLERLEAELKERIGTSAAELAPVLDGWKAERKELERKLRALEGMLAGTLAEALVAAPGALLKRLVPEAGPELLRELAHAVLARRPEAVVVLVGVRGDGSESCFLVQSGSAGPEDVSGIGGRLRERLHAKGGGKGRIFQGKGPGGADEGLLHDLE